MSIFSDFDASYGGYYTGVPSGNGGADVFHQGSVVNHIHHPQGANFEHGKLVLRTGNAVGGQDTYVDGALAKHTALNVFGGEDVYHGNELAHVTLPNVHGGIDVYDGHMPQEGMTMPNVHGGEDYLSLHGNLDEIMQHQDPLRHITKLRMEPFDAGAKNSR